jgi:ABC-2 type transport system permease protein
MATTPLGRDGLLVGKVLAILTVELIQLLVLGGVAAGLGWRPTGVLSAVLLVALGTAAFTSLALLVAGTLRAEAVLAGANLLWVLLLVGGGILLPVDTLPGGLAIVVRLLPSGALGEGLRAALGGDGLAWASVAVLGAWTLALGAAARKLFRWS